MHYSSVAAWVAWEHCVTSAKQRFWRLSVPLLVAPGLASATALLWVRAMGEFGIVMIFAFPQGMPVSMLCFAASRRVRYGKAVLS